MEAAGARSPKTKHIDTQYFAVREDVNANRLAVLPVNTHDNISDIFTKPLKYKKFSKFRLEMGVKDVSAIM